MKNGSGVQYCFSLVFFLAGLLVGPAAGQANEENVTASVPKELIGLSLEALMDIKVTSVSRKDQKLADAAAAVFVITQDDIRRSGATSIPEALRLAPGVQVARIDSNKWAVSIRGFNGRFANKLLVLVDGRSVYTQLFSGVFWESQDTVLEDIERIEVIRGPGAALWGSNAVNGVINIITKKAEDTNGAMVSGTAGSYERGTVTARYGAQLGEATDLRLYAKYLDRGTGTDFSGKTAHDSWNMTRGGFRLDSKPNDHDTFTFQGDYFDSSLNETYNFYRLPTFSNPSNTWVSNATATASGGDLLGRWQKSFSDNNSLSLQLYYDHNERNLEVVKEQRDTADIDFQHRFSLFSSQDVVWGLGYRYSHDRLGFTPFISYNGASKATNLYSAFIHDEIKLVPQKLSLILGTRLEHNDFTGFEVLPNGRLLWTPDQQNSFWGAVSRAVRTPSRTDRDLIYQALVYKAHSPNETLGQDLPLPVRVESLGNQSFKSETVISYELGYRTEPAQNISFDVALFYNSYKNLRTLSPQGLPTPENMILINGVAVPSNLVQQLVLTNNMHGRSYGVELASSWAPFDNWRLNATYSYINIAVYTDPGNLITNDKENAEKGNPNHQFSIRSAYNITRDIELDLWLRGADRVDKIGGTSIPGYVTMDARIAWKPLKGLEVSLVVQNLLRDHHPEYVPETIGTSPSEMPRSVYGKVTWNF